MKLVRSRAPDAQLASLGDAVLLLEQPQSTEEPADLPQVGASVEVHPVRARVPVDARAAPLFPEELGLIRACDAVAVGTDHEQTVSREERGML